MKNRKMIIKTITAAAMITGCIAGTMLMTGCGSQAFGQEETMPTDPAQGDTYYIDEGDVSEQNYYTEEKKYVDNGDYSDKRNITNEGDVTNNNTTNENNYSYEDNRVITEMSIDEANRTLMGVWIPVSAGEYSEAYHFGYVDAGMSETGTVYGVENLFIDDSIPGGGICAVYASIEGSVVSYTSTDDPQYAAGGPISEIEIDISSISDDRIFIDGIEYERYSGDPCTRGYQL